jgi:type IV secretion system protein VirB1
MPLLPLSSSTYFRQTRKRFAVSLHQAPPTHTLSWSSLLLLAPLFPSLAVATTVEQRSLAELAQACAPQVAYTTVRGIVKTESALNPYAIGVDDHAKARPARQPRNVLEGARLMQDLDALQVGYSAGLGQIHISHIRKNRISPEQIFDPCFNLNWLQRVLTDCHTRAAARVSAMRPPVAPDQSAQTALNMSLSCYNSGNFSTGFRNGYVQNVRKNAHKM